ncbi:glycoprotease family domain-containing protein, putative [Eimeria brunetti]|uniref:N(6)-L-threonylcarbamoyladenine synthase n=1 Tax=Eimeria brunetti TaxID=51314 RepID=U6LPT4_9EIME|nr:glycoprotease family domain-containing protein, putative [Eimeria brunetti]
MAPADPPAPSPAGLQNETPPAAPAAATAGAAAATAPQPSAESAESAAAASQPSAKSAAASAAGAAGGGLASDGSLGYCEDEVFVLGIESSANKVGVGIVTLGGRVLSNPRATFITPAGTGFLPRETAQHHQQQLPQLLQRALKEAGLTASRLSCIAYTAGPGMGAPLAVGALAARVLSLLLGLPLVPVNHCIAHIEMGIHLTGCTDPTVLYVSGGNTQVIGFSPQNRKYSILGETVDLAAGNCIDRIARGLRLPNDPAPGFQVERMAKEFENKYRNRAKEGEGEGGGGKEEGGGVLAEGGMDVAFSGLLTKAEEAIHRMHKQQQRQQRRLQQQQQQQQQGNNSVGGGEGMGEAKTETKTDGGNAAGFKTKEEAEKMAKRMRTKRSGCSSSSSSSSKNTSNQRKKNPAARAGAEGRIASKPAAAAAAAAAADNDNVDDSEDDDEMVITPELICYSLQEYMFAMLVEITERAMALYHSNSVLVVGGVGCNGRLQQMLQQMALQRGARMGGMDEGYSIDNGAMVAYVGVLVLREILKDQAERGGLRGCSSSSSSSSNRKGICCSNGDNNAISALIPLYSSSFGANSEENKPKNLLEKLTVKPTESFYRQRFRTDQVEVVWRK